MKKIIFMCFSELLSTYRDKRKTVTMLVFLSLSMFAICESAYRKGMSGHDDVFDELSSYFYFFTMLWLSGVVFAGYKTDTFCNQQVVSIDEVRLQVRRKYGALVLQTILFSLVSMPIMKAFGYHLRLMLLIALMNMCVLNITNLPIMIYRICERKVLSARKKTLLKVIESVFPVSVYLLICFFGVDVSRVDGVLWIICGLIAVGLLLYSITEGCLLRWLYSSNTCC